MTYLHSNIERSNSYNTKIGTILVLGAGGMIGRHLTHLLRETNPHFVIETLHGSAGSPAVQIASQIWFVDRSDPSSLVSLFYQTKPSIVIDLCCYDEFNARCLLPALKLGYTQRLLIVSTIAVTFSHPSTRIPHKALFKLDPRFPYSYKKALMERVVLKEDAFNHCSTTLIRPTEVHSGNDHRAIYFASRLILGQRFFYFPNAAKNTVQPVVVSDLCKVIQDLLYIDDKGVHIHNIAGPRYFKISVLIRSLAEQLGVASPRFKCMRQRAEIFLANRPYGYNRSYEIEKEKTNVSFTWPETDPLKTWANAKQFKRIAETMPAEQLKNILEAISIEHHMAFKYKPKRIIYQNGINK